MLIQCNYVLSNYAKNFAILFKFLQFVCETENLNKFFKVFFVQIIYEIGMYTIIFKNNK